MDVVADVAHAGELVLVHGARLEGFERREDDYADEYRKQLEDAA